MLKQIKLIVMVGLTLLVINSLTATQSSRLEMTRLLPNQADYGSGLSLDGSVESLNTIESSVSEDSLEVVTRSRWLTRAGDLLRNPWFRQSAKVAGGVGAAIIAVKLYQHFHDHERLDRRELLEDGLSMMPGVGEVIALGSMGYALGSLSYRVYQNHR